MRPEWLLIGWLVVFASGCAQRQYQYGLKTESTLSPIPCKSEFENPLSVGGAHPWVDRIENVVQRPRRFFDKHHGKNKRSQVWLEPPQPTALDVSTEYLTCNGLGDIYIDVRRYEPREQWDRLKANEHISPVWKYTAGSLDVLSYALIPRRAFHIDSYSPYTNTLSINSNRVASAVFAAAEAKAYRDQRLPGVYAVLQKAPIFPLIHAARVSSDALTYVHVHEGGDFVDEVYPRAYAKIASSAVSEALYFVPLPADLPPITAPIARIAGVSLGKATGKLMAEKQRRRFDAESKTNSLQSRD